MRHAAEQGTRAAILFATLAWPFTTATAQASLREALVPASRGTLAVGTESAVAASTSVAGALQAVAEQAAVAFTGSVTAVKADPVGGAVVRFQVERVVRGAVAADGTYTMHTSRWGGDTGRFYTGERALFLLTAPSVAGYSAPVMGERGVVPLTGDALVGNLDLRWIAADVQRGTAAADVSSGETLSQQPNTVLAASMPENGAGQGRRGSASAAESSGVLPDVHSIDRDLVLDLLRSSVSTVGQNR